MMTWPGSTWLTLIFCYNTGAQEETSLCSKNSLRL